MKGYSALIVLVIGICLISCEPDKTCRQDVDVRARLVLRCYHHDTLDVVSEVTQWDSITVQGVGSDSILYSNTKSAKELLLPLRGDTTVTAYTLLWNGKTETLYIRHSNTQRFVSMACGCVIYHQIEDVWCDKVWADSVVIINAAVETVEQDNIRIYATTRDSKP